MERRESPVEDLVKGTKTRTRSRPAGCAFGGVYAGSRVFVTGHTGFKGSWLCEWLRALGAEVTGFSLAPPTQPSLFEQVGLAKRLNHLEGDIRHSAGLTEAVHDAQPDYIFHLAAQPLVRESYRTPGGDL